ncbi:MAG: hypothetical protein R3D00_04260 [Bacteroidia bacterium]
MSDYKINIDKPLPDPKIIDRHKDFDGLYDQYQVTRRFDFWRNIYRKPIYFASVAASAAIIFLVFEAVNEELPSEKSVSVLPPLAANDPALLILKVNASAPFSFESASCSQVQIPADAFTDINGNLVSGEVEIYYREQLAATSLTEETATGDHPLGMVEISGFQNGKPLKLSENKAIEVAFFSLDTSDDYQVYTLNEKQDEWILSGNDQVLLAEATNRILPKPERPASTYILEQPEDRLIPKSVETIVPKPGKPFGIKIKNPEDFAEFRNYEKIYWEYLQRPGSANPWEEGLLGENSPWNDVRVRKISAREYELRFARLNASGGISTQTVFATPMFEAKSKEAADELYRERYLAWENAKKAREQQAEERRQDQEKMAAAERDYRAYQQKLKEWESAMADTANTVSPKGAYHKFSVSQTGAFKLAKDKP